MKLDDDIKNEFKLICKKYYLPFKEDMNQRFIRKFFKNIQWYGYFQNNKLSEKFIKKFHYAIPWNALCLEQNLSDDILISFKDKIDWHSICQNQQLSYDVIKQCKKYIDWRTLARTSKILTEVEVIKKFENYLDNSNGWYYLSRNKYLTEDVVRKYFSKLDKNYIFDYACKYQFDPMFLETMKVFS